MAYTWLDATKDFLGALGPVLIAVPWFSEYDIKRRRRSLKLIPTEGGLSKLKTKMVDRMTDHIDSAKLSDMIWNVLGLSCICASFVIALVENVGELFKSS